MSNPKHIEEMRSLSARLGELGRANRPPRTADVERYAQLAQELKAPQCLSDALLEKALALVREGRLLEATQVFEPALREAPFSSALVKASENILGMVHDELIAIASYDPAHAEFGPAFERLLELGWVGHPVQMGAIRHYTVRGQTEKAIARLLLLARIAPKAPGLAELALKLAECSDDPELQQFCQRYEGGQQ